MQTELFPFSFAEFCDYKKVDKSFLTTKQKGLLQAIFDQFLHEGGFPELLEENRKQSYINTLVKNILQNDIEKRYAIKYKNAFENLTSHLLDNAPSNINYKELQNMFSFKSDHTAENYVQYLKNAYLIQGLHKYSSKSKIRLRNEKAYVVDVALMNNRENAFEGDNLGWRLENLVYIELLRRYKPLEYDVYYYAETTFEADFILCKGKTVEKIIQVSYNISDAKTKRREVNGLIKTSEKLKCNDLLLINYYDDGDEQINGKQIKIVSAYKWFLSFKNSSRSILASKNQFFQ